MHQKILSRKLKNNLNNCKILANHTFDNNLISRFLKTLTFQNQKENSVKKMGKGLELTFLQRRYSCI